MQTTTLWGKSFVLTLQRKNRKYYSFRRIPGSLRNHNADGNGDVKEAIGLITKRTTLYVHHAFCSFLTARLKRETFQWDIL